ncbi:MAG: nickel pincer cofactor biosynthesis protein LarB [Thermoplasmatales archaeon]|jgi:NCAIR mutase (PurE)-related protein|nr:nickel pincer cofactor biosynthesis protein LarB [Thermoplasmatales archaeon]
MDIRDVLEAYKQDKISPEDAEKLLRMDYLERIGQDCVLDRSRSMRKGIPEVVYGAPKTPDKVAEICASRPGSLLLVSKAGRDHFEAVRKKVPDAEFREDCGIIVVGKMPEPVKGLIGIITAGTSDVPVAEEAAVMAEAMGVKVMKYYDVGVAGLHRISEPVKELIEADADAIVVVAGMEGALPTLVSSMSTSPVIGVPTSTGYGAGGKGEAALLCMLQTCSPGLTAVNIDNGIGGGGMAALIANRRSERKSQSNK